MFWYDMKCDNRIDVNRSACAVRSYFHTTSICILPCQIVWGVTNEVEMTFQLHFMTSLNVCVGCRLKVHTAWPLFIPVNMKMSCCRLFNGSFDKGTSLVTSSGPHERQKNEYNGKSARFWGERLLFFWQNHQLSSPAWYSKLMLPTPVEKATSYVFQWP